MRVDELDDDAGGADDDAVVEVTDAELAELALAADPDAPIADDAVPFGRADQGALLPDWYMPVPMGPSRRGRTRLTVGVIVLSLLALNAVGLCVTYGVVELAW
ncbi:MAG: hypothetical protein U0Q03_24655 [Acidimicrobiales bacterium]